MAKGVRQAQEAREAGFSRQPRLRLVAGDRARFHFIGDGGEADEFFGGARFHSFQMTSQSGKNYRREILCVRAHTDGEETCSFCEEGHDDMSKKFAVWIYVHHILHAADNPSQEEGEGEPWEQVRMQGERGKSGRIVFKEIVDEPLLIWMPYGRGGAWFGQFHEAWVKYGSLQGRIYQLRRVGKGMDDTDYTLSVIKEAKLPKEAADSIAEVVQPVEDVFRETITGGSAPRPIRMTEEEGPPPGTIDEEEPEGEAQDLPAMEEEAEGTDLV